MPGRLRSGWSAEVRAGVLLDLPPVVGTSHRAGDRFVRVIDLDRRIRWARRLRELPWWSLRPGRDRGRFPRR